MTVNRKHFKKLSSLVRCFTAAGAGLAVFTGAIYLASIGLSAAADTNAPATTVSIPKAANTNAVVKPDKKVEVRPKRQLSGVELYAIHCNRCHPERYPAEFTDGQWKTLMAHMRVRANLPPEQARLILQYLQDESGHY